MTRTSHPPKPRFALSVGVIGHRPNRLPEEMRPRIARDLADVLAAIQTEALAAHRRYIDMFCDSPARLVLVSAMAEGADCMAAEAALALGYELQAPIPFSAGEYESDFGGPDGPRKFRRLLDLAGSVLELDGNRRQPEKAYATAGVVLLDNCDVLLAVWDGGGAHGRGGTAELVHEASRRGIPIIRVDVSSEHPPWLQWRGLAGAHTAPMHADDNPTALLTDALAPAIDALIRPPHDQSERQGLQRYFAERAPRFAVRLEYRLLMILLGVRSLQPGGNIRRDPEQLAAEAGADGSGASAINRAFAWAGAVAVRLAQVFRSAVVTNFLASAIAVLVAVALYFPWSGIELVLILFVVVNAFVGHSQRWHHRWIESRELAERLRVGSAMHALATRSPTPFGPAATWPVWYGRALTRQAGLRSGRIGKDELIAAKQKLLDLVRGQAGYHTATARQFKRLHDRLARVGLAFFLLALLVSAGTFASRLLHLFVMTPVINHWVVIISASLPALGSASYGIRVIGDFEGTAKRSARMRVELDALAATIETGSSDFDWLRDRAFKASDIMLGDVAIWRLLVESRELSTPG